MSESAINTPTIEPQSGILVQTPTGHDSDRVSINSVPRSAPAVPAGEVSGSIQCGEAKHQFRTAHPRSGTLPNAPPPVAELPRPPHALQRESYHGTETVNAAKAASVASGQVLENMPIEEEDYTPNAEGRVTFYSVFGSMES